MFCFMVIIEEINCIWNYYTFSK